MRIHPFTVTILFFLGATYVLSGYEKTPISYAIVGTLSVYALFSKTQRTIRIVLIATAVLLTMKYPPAQVVRPECVTNAHVLYPAHMKTNHAWRATVRAHELTRPFSVSGVGEMPNMHTTYEWCGEWVHTRWQPYYSGAPSGLFEIHISAETDSRFSVSGLVWELSAQTARSLESGINASVPYPTGAFLAGLLWAGRNALDEGWQALFQRVGLTHILAVSGFNVVVVFSSLERILRNAHPNIRYGIAFCGIVFFAMMAGASSPVVRSVLFVMALFWLKKSGHIVVGWRILLVVLVVMTILKPYALRHDIGLQLSFLAVLGLMQFSEKWSRAWKRIPEWGGIRESFVNSCASSVYTIPLIAVYFKSVSIIAPVSNIFVLWSLPYLMALGTLQSLIGSTNIGAIAGSVAWGFGRFILHVIDLFARIPFGFFSWREPYE